MKGGGHHYPGAPGHNPKDPGDCYTSDCSYGCGAWAGPSRSGAPEGIDPWGPCPKAPPEPEHTPPEKLTLHLRFCDGCGRTGDFLTVVGTDEPGMSQYQGLPGAHIPADEKWDERSPQLCPGTVHTVVYTAETGWHGKIATQAIAVEIVAYDPRPETGPL